MKLLKRALSFIMVLCFTLCLFVVAEHVTAAEESITIKYNDTFTPAFPTSSGNTTATEHTDTTAAANNFKFEEKGIRSYSGYLMFVQNQGYLYNSESLGTVKTVSITYSDGTSTSAKIGVYFGATKESVATYTTSSNQTIAGKNGTDTFTNTTNGNGFFQISTSNRNCQIIEIVITYDKEAEAATPLLAPTGFTVLENTVTINEVANATGYSVGLFTEETAENPAYVIDSDTNVVEIKDVPQDTAYVLKVMAKATGSYTNSPWFSQTEPTTFVNTNVSTYTITKVKTEIETQNEAPWIYYNVTGYIQELGTTEYSQLQIADTLEDTTYLTVRGIADYDSYNFSVGDKVTLKGYKSNNQLQGTTVVEHTVNYGDRFTALNTVARLNVTYKTTEGAAQGWAKVTDAASLKAGDQIIIVNEANKVAISTTQNSNNRASTEFDVNNISDAVQKLTLGGSEGSWTFYATGGLDNAVGYLYAAGGTGNNNHLKTQETLSAPGYWTIAISDGNATIKTADTTVARHTIKLNNNNNNIFSCYASGQQNVQIYRFQETASFEIVKDENSKPQVALMFGGIIDKALYDELLKIEGTKFGMLYATTSTLGQDTLQGNIDLVNNGTFTFEEMLEASGVTALDLTTTMARINNVGAEDNEGEFYQLGVVLNNVNEAKFDVEVTAACYVLYDGAYYLMNVKAYSVNTIAQVYIDAEDTSSYEEHLSMLTWLKGYKGE